MYEERLGDKYLETNPFRALLDKGVVLCAGSDSDVIPCLPMLSLYSAVNRPVKEHNVTVYEALEMMTNSAAYAIFKEDVKGYLKKGYLADILIMSEDIFKIDKEDIKDAKVTMTIKSGKIVYKDKGYHA